MPAYVYVRASREDVVRLNDVELYFPTPMSLGDAINEKVKIYVDVERHLYDYEPFDTAAAYNEILSNYVVGVAVNPVTGLCNFDMVVVYRNGEQERAYLVRAGTRVYIVEGRGHRVYPLVSEGSRIVEGSKLFYILTGKYEVRVVRSPRAGILLLYSELIPYEIQVLRAVMVDEDVLVKLERARHRAR